jgi:uncharacterized protein YijF (DUF1287 family)
MRKFAKAKKGFIKAEKIKPIEEPVFQEVIGGNSYKYKGGEMVSFHGTNGLPFVGVVSADLKTITGNEINAFGQQQYKRYFISEVINLL